MFLSKPATVNGAGYIKHLLKRMRLNCGPENGSNSRLAKACAAQWARGGLAARPWVTWHPGFLCRVIAPPPALTYHGPARLGRSRASEQLFPEVVQVRGQPLRVVAEQPCLCC